ncbi:MAG: ABC transporter substrate-binding protein [Oscillospiraceae bacterium]|jgi:branched-chain amino acid transport system substrate-binding protein|nr:ABC transporter substrate-binding protein [Oscillospiraceae bacterium]
MKKFAKLTAMLLALCLCVSMAACSGAPAPASSAGEAPPSSAAEIPPVVKVAVAFPLSGASAELGMMGRDGVELGIKRINDSGGIKALGGAKIEMVTADTTSDPAQAKTVVERLVADPDIMCFFGVGSSALMMPLLPVLEKNEVPAITNCGSQNITNQGYKYVFQVPHSVNQGGENVMAFLNWLNTEQGYDYTKVGLVYENSSFGLDMAEGSRDEAEELGLDIVFDESFPPGLTDASALITAMKNSGASVFIPATYASESKLLIETMNNLDYHPLIIGPVAWPSLAEGLGDAVNGIISTGSWSWNTKNIAENPEYSAIVKEFEETYGYFMTEQSGPNFVATQILQAALEASAATTRQDLRNAISAVKLENSMISPGPLEFDENGVNIHARAVCHQWQDGVPCAIYPVEYAVTEFIDPSSMK